MHKQWSVSSMRPHDVVDRVEVVAGSQTVIISTLEDGLCVEGIIMVVKDDYRKRQGSALVIVGQMAGAQQILEQSQCRFLIT